MQVTRSAGDYATVLNRLMQAIAGRGLTVFASIDHGAGARAADLELGDEQVVIFGDPRAGTPLMQADRRIGIALPLRMLVWRDDDGVAVGFEDPRELAGPYDVAGQSARLEAMAGLLETLAAHAAG